MVFPECINSDMHAIYVKPANPSQNSGQESKEYFV